MQDFLRNTNCLKWKKPYPERVKTLVSMKGELVPEWRWDEPLFPLKYVSCGDWNLANAIETRAWSRGILRGVLLDTSSWQFCIPIPFHQICKAKQYTLDFNNREQEISLSSDSIQKIQNDTRNRLSASVWSCRCPISWKTVLSYQNEINKKRVEFNVSEMDNNTSDVSEAWLGAASIHIAH